MKKAAPAAPAQAAAGQPERWRIEAGDGDVATLVIPADSWRTRRFEIDCRFIVMRLAEGAQHGMRVDVDGGLESARTHREPGPHRFDGLPLSP
jgi:hypothetical protein